MILTYNKCIFWNVELEGGEEIIVIETESTQTQHESFQWNRENTLLLIDIYKTLKNKVGTLQIRNLKALYKIIADKIAERINRPLLPRHVENRWKVLERNYRKYIDNKNATGRGRIKFEFAEYMDAIYEKKKNLNPVLLLSTESVDNRLLTNIKENVLPTETLDGSDPELLTASTTLPSTTNFETNRRRKMSKRKTVLERIREDRLHYQNKRLKILENNSEQMLSIQKERNRILNEKNSILREKKCHCNV